MKYTMILWPHSNARYRSETLKLAKSELNVMFARVAPESEVSGAECLDLPAISIQTAEPLSENALRAIQRASLLYGLFETRPDGAMIPVIGRERAYLGEDLPGVLKYKGKTNELFTQLLINVGLYAGDYFAPEMPVRLYDPMCGRGTTLLVGANRGWNCTGTDVDRRDLNEGEQFLKRYLEYHRLKHAVERESLTLTGKNHAACVKFTFSDTPQNYKKGETASARMVNCDACEARNAFGAKAFHLIACDLPYGVQHASEGASIEKLLSRALPIWKKTLAPGGTIALSFNAQTLKRDRVREMMAEAEMEPMTGGAWDVFSHWVEQAVTRDIAVCRRI